MGKLIKKFLAGRSLKAETKTNFNSKTNSISLTSDHTLFIDNNYLTMNSAEIARILFNNKALNNLSAESRAIEEYKKSKNLQVPYTAGVEENSVPTEAYIPPKRLDTCLTRVNVYTNNSIDPQKLTAAERRGLQSLIGYLHTHRFLRQINSYDNQNDRNSFEDAFIRYTYNKSDLGQEDVDEFLTLATEVVMGFSIQRRSEALQRQLDNVTGAGEEHARISMSLVEAIGKAQGEYNQCVIRQQKLRQSLVEKRSDRVAKTISENTFLNFYEQFRQEETRREWVQIAREEQKEVSLEVDRLSKIDALQAKMLGISSEEIVNG